MPNSWPRSWRQKKKLVLSSNWPRWRKNELDSYIILYIAMDSKYLLLLSALVIAISCQDLTDTLSCLKDYIQTFKDQTVPPFRPRKPNCTKCLVTPTPTLSAPPSNTSTSLQAAKGLTSLLGTLRRCGWGTLPTNSCRTWRSAENAPK